MNGPLDAAAAIVLGYLVGAIPFGLLVGRLVGGVDLRRYGSRRTGATNALRTMGMRWGAVVFLLDLGKGLAAVLLARLMNPDAGDVAEWVPATAGLAAVIGHNWSVFIRFSGGRGVATTAGGLLALSPLSVAILVPIAATVVWRTRYVSAGSLVGAVGAMLVTVALAAAGAGSWATVGYAVAAGLLVIVSHADNIGRLRAGTERRIGEKEELLGHGRS